MDTKRPSRSLFDRNYKSHAAKAARDDLPYWALMRHIYDPGDTRFGGGETDIFHALFEDEQWLSEPTHAIAGPLTVHQRGRKPIDLRKRKWISLPAWVESDALNFTIHGAKGILAIEKGTVFARLAESAHMRHLNMIFVGTMGIPKVATRRVLHRLSEQSGLPIYLLADNDTWGYFIFSVLKRGMMAPHLALPYLAVPKIRFLGARAGEWTKTGRPPEHVLIFWKKYWNLRLRAMRTYPCFKSRSWQDEFSAFERQGGKFEAVALLGIMGTKSFVREYLEEKLKGRLWLD